MYLKLLRKGVNAQVFMQGVFYYTTGIIYLCTVTIIPCEKIFTQGGYNVLTQVLLELSNFNKLQII